MDPDDLDTQAYYDRLNVPRSATQAEIRRAYNSLSRAFHPDKQPAGGGGGPNDDDSGGGGGAAGTFAELHEAFEVRLPDVLPQGVRRVSSWLSAVTHAARFIAPPMIAASRRGMCGCCESTQSIMPPPVAAASLARPPASIVPTHTQCALQRRLSAIGSATAPARLAQLRVCFAPPGRARAQVLSTPERRRVYDAYGKAGLRSGLELAVSSDPAAARKEFEAYRQRAAAAKRADEAAPGAKVVVRVNALRAARELLEWDMPSAWPVVAAAQVSTSVAGKLDETAGASVGGARSQLSLNHWD